MTESQFSDAVLERLFVRGFNCRNVYQLLSYARVELGTADDWPDVDSFAEKCMQLPDVTYRPELEKRFASSTAGACEKWLGVHEAGHAIVGVNAGFILRGVRFYGHDGFRGETGLDHPEWQTSNDEKFLRRLIRLDVAGNVAELLHPACKQPQGGRLSRLYDDLTPGDRPSDFISADRRAGRLAVVLLGWDGKLPVPDAIWVAKRAMLAQAEAEAESVLQAYMEVMDHLADHLVHGPMTGGAVRALIGA